eukprot:4425780-Pyramimonas_sp.AAC.1
MPVYSNSNEFEWVERMPKSGMLLTRCEGYSYFAMEDTFRLSTRPIVDKTRGILEEFGNISSRVLDLSKASIWDGRWMDRAGLTFSSQAAFDQFR